MIASQGLFFSLVFSSLVGMGSWYITASYKDAKFLAMQAAEEKKGLLILEEARKHVSDIEQRYAIVANKLEVESVKKQNEINKLYADNKRLADELGGLRDPYGTGQSCVNSLPGFAEASSELDIEATCSSLSKEASKFLLEFARDADEAAAYAATCYEWIQQIHN